MSIRNVRPRETGHTETLAREASILGRVRTCSIPA
jgi:hypothetical protein